MRLIKLLGMTLIAGLTAMMSVAVAADQPQAEATEVQALTMMTLDYVIATAFQTQRTRLDYDGDKSAVLAEISAMPPDVRNLFWLSYLQSEIPSGELHQFFTKAAEDRAISEQAKQILIEQGKAGASEWLQQFNQMNDAADPLRQADAVSKALSAAGMTRQAQAFAAVQALAARNVGGDLSGFDTAFGSKAEFQGAIDAYVERTPALVAWSDEARAGIGDEDRLAYLTQQLDAMDAARIERLPPELKQVFVVDYFNAEMLNGGVHQFFFNSSGQYAPQVVTGMKEMGLGKEADVVQRGIDMFSKPYPTDTQRRRQLHFGKDWSEWDDRLSALTDAVDDGAITPALIAFAKQHELMPR